MRNRILELRPLTALLWLWASGAAAQTSTAFYYGSELPVELTRSYDRVVVEPDHGFDPLGREPESAELVAYLSVGEVAGTSARRAQLKSEWVVAENAAWKSVVVDLSSEALRTHVLDAHFERLWQQGYRSFFLDTLDSYMQLPSGREAQQRGLVALVRAMHARHPEVKLLFNRGFEVLDVLAPLVDTVVAESLFDRYDAASARYVRVPEGDRAWLLSKLREAQSRHGLPVVVIDYRPVHQRKEALATAARIVELGFSPYVTDGALMSVGTGPFQVVPRRVLVLTNHGPLAETRPRQVLGPLLEALGLLPTYVDVSRGVPQVTPGSVLGAVAWFEGTTLTASYPAFVERLRADGVRWVFFGDPRLPADAPAARLLGLAAYAGTLEGSLRLVGDSLAAEGTGPVLQAQLPGIQLVAPRASVHLAAEDAAGERLPLVATTNWGGIALSHFLAPRGLAGEQAFAIDPLSFLERGLGVAGTPRVDLTTEDGARIARVVVRAAGLAEDSRHPGRPPVEVLLRRLMRRYPGALGLDLQPSEFNPVTEADRRAARSLLRKKGVELESPAPSRTLQLATESSLAQLTPLLPLPLEGAAALTLAGDDRYLPEGVSEAYPFRRLVETWKRTDAPRRLCPAVLDYHARSLASPGGYEAIATLHAHLKSEKMHVISGAELDARARDFRRAVLVRHTDGGYELRGAGALRTLRLPEGTRLSEESRGVSTVHAHPSGTFVSFARGHSRRLYLDDDAGVPGAQARAPLGRNDR